jgi:DNA-binding transcriptional LysR family regulator
VDLNLRQGTQIEIIDWVSRGVIDLGIGGSPRNPPANVLALDAYPIERCVAARAGHPILEITRITLKDIAGYPIIAHDVNNETGAVLRAEMARAGLTPHIVVNAQDSDVVLRYVAAGMGIALVPALVLEHERLRGIRSRDVGHIFPPTMARIRLRKGAFLRSFTYDLIGMIAPQWTRAEIERAAGRPP